MKTREEAARFVEAQLDDDAGAAKVKEVGAWHYGRRELKQLMDFVFGGSPADKSEEITDNKGAI